MRQYPPTQFAVDKDIAGASQSPAPPATPAKLGNLTATRVRPVILLVVCGFALVVSIIILTTALISRLHNHSLANTERELENTALILAEYTDRALQSIELVQKSFLDSVQSVGISTSEQFKREMSSKAINQLLQDKISGLPHVDAITIIDAEGNLINSSRDWPSPPINIADRDRFRLLKTDPKLTWSIGEAVRNRFAGDWTVNLARKVAGPNGEFLGLVQGSMQLSYFEKLFQTIVLGEQASISLFRNDGMLLVRYPRIETAIGRPLTDVADAFGERDHITVRLVTKLTGNQRLIAGHKLAHFPLFAAVGLDVEAALSAWRNEAIFLASAGGLVAIGVTIIFIVIVRNSMLGLRWSQRRLYEQKLQLDMALDNMSHGILMFDSESRIVVCNRRYIDMYGLSPDVVKPGCTFRNLIAHRKETGSFVGDVEQYCSEVKAQIDSGEAATSIVTTADGRSMEVTNRPFSDGSWIGTHQDVTQRKRHEAALSESEKMARGIIDTALDAFIQLDERGVIVEWNPQAEKTFGWSDQEAIGKRLVDLIVPEAHRARHKEGVSRFLRTGKSNLLGKRTVIDALCKDERQIKVELGITALQRNSGYVFNGFIKDLTEKHAADEQIRQFQKMEAISNLTGGLAHDFNNLLLIIIGNLDLLQENIHNDSGAAQQLGAALDASLRGAELTRQLLAFSRRQPLQPKIVDVGQVITKTSKLLARTLGGNINIDLRLATETPGLLIDETQFEAAIINLAVNARDAMSNGGTLTIESGMSRLGADETLLGSGRAPGKYTVVEVRDTGAGMPPDVAARIFEPFFTTKDTGKGTGLGLSMVYGFIKQSGGYIGVESEVGKGTAVKLYLPCAATTVQPAEDTVLLQAASIRPSGAVILAVDDNPDVRTTAVKNLKALGYQVLEADCANRALEELDSGTKIDLLFTDIIMPGGINGNELAKLARIKRPGLKVLYTSGFPGTQIGGTVEIETDAPLLNKPYRRNELAKLVADVLDAA